MSASSVVFGGEKAVECSLHKEHFKDGDKERMVTSVSVPVSLMGRCLLGVW